MNFPPPTPEQARVIWLAVTALAGAVIVAILAGIIWGFGQVLRLLSPVLWPLAVAEFSLTCLIRSWMSSSAGRAATAGDHLRVALAA